jgi:hypothetical protein
MMEALSHLLEFEVGGEKQWLAAFFSSSHADSLDMAFGSAELGRYKQGEQ